MEKRLPSKFVVRFVLCDRLTKTTKNSQRENVIVIENLVYFCLFFFVQSLCGKDLLLVSY